MLTRTLFGAVWFAEMPTRLGRWTCLDQSHAHRQFPDHLYRDGQIYPTDPNTDYANDLFTRESVDFIGATSPVRFFCT